MLAGDGRAEDGEFADNDDDDEGSRGVTGDFFLISIGGCEDIKDDDNDDTEHVDIDDGDEGALTTLEAMLSPRLLADGDNALGEGIDDGDDDKDDGDTEDDDNEDDDNEDDGAEA